MKIGLIQSRGLGDIIIALPIARWYQQHGHEVYWPVDRRFATMLQRVVDYATFIPFDFEHTLDGFLYEPRRLLQERKCDKTVILYSYLSDIPTLNPALFNSLKFDEYKYAVAGVPFTEKWSLMIKRDIGRERELFSRLVKPNTPYVVTHALPGQTVVIPPEYKRHQHIVLTEETDSLFDWMMILESAALVIMVDSSPANLVEQWNIPAKKQLILRSEVRFTPVFARDWTYYGVAT